MRELKFLLSVMESPKLHKDYNENINNFFLVCLDSESGFLSNSDYMIVNC